MMRSSCGRLRWAVAALAAPVTLMIATMLWLPFAGFAVVPAATPQKNADAKGEGQPARLGLVERAGVSLTLLDVEVTDERGKPLRGLKKEDFRVRLNGREWPLYSVDDLCTCEEDAVAGRGVQRPQGPPAASKSAASSSGGGFRSPPPSREAAPSAAASDAAAPVIPPAGALSP